MDKNLFEASFTGNIQLLNALLKDDKLILDRVSLTCYNETPLHIAAMRGHLDFVRIVLSQKPVLAMSLDSLRRTPLHLASAEGHVEIVRELLRVMTSDKCRFRDEDGRTPMHLAAMNEQLEIIKVLIQTKPDLARELNENGETILHTCIVYNRFEALKLLSEPWNEEYLATLSDHNGNTLLHLAVVHKQIQTVKYLLQKSSIKSTGNIVNRNGFTALDVLDHCPTDFKAIEIKTILMEYDILRAKDVKPYARSSQNVSNLWSKPKGCMSRVWNWYLNENGNWLEKQRGILILATVMVAGSSFYSGLHPPGGTFSDASAGPLGDAVQTVADKGAFTTFLIQNTIIMVISLMILVVLLSGIALRNKFCLWLLNLATLCIVFFAMFTYLREIAWMSPDDRVNTTTLFLGFGWILVCLLFGLVHTIFFLIWVIKKLSNARTTTRNEDSVGV